MRTRLWAGARRHGLLDGAWTLLANLGSKLQTLALIAVATRAYGLAETGRVLLAIAISTLVVTAVDAGLTPQVSRLYAVGSVSGVRILLGPLWPRVIMVLAAGAIAGGLLQTSVEGWRAYSYGCTTAIFAATTLVARILIAAAYGLGAFRAGSTAIGVSRLAAILFLFAIPLTTDNGAVLLLPLAVAELAVAIVAGRIVRRARSITGQADPDGLTLRRTAVFGVSAVLNSASNRSDALLASFTLSSVGLGVYATASQLQGALSTTALIPAAALVTHVARGSRPLDASRTLVVNAYAVMGTYIFLALGLIVTQPLWIPVLVGSDSDLDLGVLYLCLVAGLFSGLGGVFSQFLTGAGASRYVAITWLTVLIVAVCSFTVGGLTGGVMGVALAAVARDITFAAVGGLLCARTTRKGS